MGSPSPFARRFLATFLASLPALATTTSFSFNVSGSVGSTQTSPTTLNYQANATGTATPFGSASFVLAGTLTATSSSSGSVTGTLTATFGNGDSIQASYSGINVVFAADGSTSASGNATITGGTGGFQNATGTLNFNYKDVNSGHMASHFTLSGSGMVTTGGASGVLSVSPPSLTFSFVQGSSSTASQPVVVNNGLQQAEAFSATATGGSWLTVLPASGSAQALSSASVIVSVDPTGLAAGTYSGTIGITSPGGGPFAIPVTMTISAMAEGIVLSQNGLRFEVAAGSSTPPGQQIVVVDQGTGSVDWTTAVNGSSSSWLSVTPSTGTSTPTSSGTATISVNPSGLQPGDYYGVVYFATTNGPAQSVIVVFTVTSVNTPLAPSVLPSGVVFTSPQGGTPTPSSLVVTATNPSMQPLNLSAGTVYLNAGGWLNVNPPSATISTSQQAQFTVSVNPAGLAVGIYRATLQFVLPDGSILPVDVLLVVSSSTSPSMNGLPSLGAAPAGSCSPTQFLTVSTMLPNGFKATAAWPVPLEVIVVDDCGSPLKTGTVGASFSTGDPALSLIPLGDGRWTGTWQPRSIKASNEVITFLAHAQHPTLTGTAQTSGTVQPNKTAPTIAAGGVVNAASYAAHAPLAPGDLIAIFGLHMASGVGKAKSLPLSTKLNGTRARLAGEPMPLLFTTDGQIDAQVPYDAPTNTALQLVIQNNGAYSLPELVTIAPAAPAVLTANGSGKGLGLIVVVKPNGQQFLADPHHPASAGDALVIYTEGLGAVNPAVASGAAAPSKPLAKTTNKVTATIGGVAGKAAFSGLTPGFVGLYQVNLVVPKGVSPGPSVPIVFTEAGQSSPPVTIPIQ